MKIYPAIDLMDGRCVRLTKGSFDEVTRYSGEPAQVASSFARAGARFLHVVDLDGARAGSVAQHALVAAIVKASGLEVQVGGGLRTLEQARSWLEAGVARVVMGSLAVKDPVTAERIVREVGAERVTLAVDFRKNARGRAVVATSGWQETGGAFVPDVIERYAQLGVARFLCTDIERDGTMEGPNVALYAGWQESFAELELQVSGGIGGLDDLKALSGAGAKAVIVGKALYEGRLSLEDALRC